MKPIIKLSKALMVFGVLSIIAGCTLFEDYSADVVEKSTVPADSNKDVLTGVVEVDGSSTVYPISEAVAEEFAKEYKNVRVNVGVSGTGGGFKRFAIGETDVSDASREIKPKEAAKAAENNVEFYELRLGDDGLSVMVNPANDFVDCLTVAELKMIWEPGSTINDWNQVRSTFPSGKIRLYGPDTDSGTFDYFTEEINGEAQASRPDYTASADDNVLVSGISGDKYALGYFGYAFFIENQDKLKLVDIDSGDGCVAPSPETIKDGSYKPLARPLFIYVSVNSYTSKPQVKTFVDFYMDHGPKLTSEVGYISSESSVYAENKTMLEK